MILIPSLIDQLETDPFLEEPYDASKPITNSQSCSVISPSASPISKKPPRIDSKANFIDITNKSDDSDEDLNAFMSAIIEKSTKNLMSNAYNRAFSDIAKLEEIEEKMDQVPDASFIVEADGFISCSLCGVRKELKNRWARKNFFQHFDSEKHISKKKNYVMEQK